MDIELQPEKEEEPSPRKIFYIRFWDWLTSHEAKFSLMLLSFLLLFIVQPMMESDRNEKIFINIVLSLIIISAIHTVSNWRFPTILAVVFGSLSLVGGWLSFFCEFPLVNVVSLICGIITIVICAYMILQVTISSRKVSYDTISGAVCIYMLLGFLGGIVCVLIEYTTPGSFFFGHETINTKDSILDGKGFSSMVYFSYITITSVGFGDIVPVGRLARSISIILAICGQIYMTVIMAILVGVYINELMRRRMVRHELRSARSLKIIEDMEKKSQDK